MREEQRDSSNSSSMKTSHELNSSNDNKSSLAASNVAGTTTPNTDEEFVGPDYEEDDYYSGGLTATPSFDDLEASDSEEILVHWHHDSGEFEEIREAEFREDKGHLRGTRGELRQLRQKLREKSRQLLNLVRGEDAVLHRSGSLSPSLDSVANEFHSLSIEEQERQKAEWSAELARIEDEIQTLREVLASKVRTAHDLKRKLGISVWKELSSDVSQGLKNVKETNVFQKTESVLKSTAEKTTSILGGFGSGLSMKIGQMRNSDSFRSLEEKVGSAYENVKQGRMTPSRSNSTQSFDEALREAGASRRTSAAPSVTSPTIPEDKMLS
ncbi:tumor protein D52 isoform X3 [Trichogramma pretiosum]|uniref:tumor protein D52 isoform X3 n=1 Tax=Trichogramma pretiosum TaxID=7493 RepID=UPI0006C959F3|nr:tumor protein D52 isoform X3 [Trichogramma pretiosum]